MKLYEYAQLVRSKNAGPFMLTIDIIFPTDDVYRKVLKSGALEADGVAKLLNIPVNVIKRYELPLARAIKFSYPRSVPCGDFLDEDLYGCQQHRNLVYLDIPD